MGDRQPHACNYHWCTNKGTDSVIQEEHRSGDYTTATGAARAENWFEVEGVACVGAGVTYVTIEQSYPTIWLHVYGSNGKRDVSTEMRIDEAIQLEKLLEDAITDAMTVPLPWEASK